MMSCPGDTRSRPPTGPNWMPFDWSAEPSFRGEPDWMHPPLSTNGTRTVQPCRMSAPNRCPTGFVGLSSAACPTEWMARDERRASSIGLIWTGRQAGSREPACRCALEKQLLRLDVQILVGDGADRIGVVALDVRADAVE